MRGVRTTLAIAVIGFVLTAAGRDTSASSAAASLAVSVRVVPACTVRARAVDQTSAAIQLRCSAGHASSVLVSREQLAAPRSVVHVPSGEGMTPDGPRTVTVNF